MDTKFAVIGAGNCGQTMAAHLKSLNQNVKLFNRSIKKLNEIKHNNGIKLSNMVSGKWMPDLVTNDIKKAIENVDMIMITTPASSHKDLAATIAPHLKEDQTVILNPGRTFGALEFLNVARVNGLKKDVTIAEAQTTIYTCRTVKNGDADLISIKNNVMIGSIPANNISEVIEKIKDIYPQFKPVKNTLVTGLNNIGAILHPTPTLFNLGWIEHPNNNLTSKD
jgi:opine dehydrogenase